MAESKISSMPTIARERQLILLLEAFLITGILFMIFPGTFLGVWNLFSISSSHSTANIPVALIQAHGHAQVFGWIGSFILGIGFYSIPNLRRISKASFAIGWLIWALWTVGVALHWFAGFYQWQWRFLFPVSALLELSAVLLFLACSIQGHRFGQESKQKVETWAILVIAGTVGLVIAMCANLFESVEIALWGAAPQFPMDFNGRFLVLSIWGFPVMIAWGFSAHWIPVFLSLKPLRSNFLLAALIVAIVGVISYLLGDSLIGASLLCGAAFLVALALRIFEPAIDKAKTQGVHKTFPSFIRISYVWLLVSSLLNIWAALQPESSGITGSARHAVTVGFLMTMVFSIGPRILPAFLGKKALYSMGLMFLSLVLINIGCFLRVLSEISAYENYASSAWLLLPISATLELTGVVIFAANMLVTFLKPPLVAMENCADK
ncbi:MAG: NnrS family protein [Candidatus Obscuribacterales bacterium]|nr:NnrS family protein [Candidatus Obscuribacterales bacterium]